MPKRVRSYKAAQQERLKNSAYAAEYINAAIEAGDEAALLLALRNVAEAKGINSVATQAGVSRESVYRMLSKAGNPCYASLRGILGALGLQFKIQPSFKQSEPDILDYGGFKGTPLIWEVGDRPCSNFFTSFDNLASAYREQMHDRE